MPAMRLGLRVCQVWLYRRRMVHVPGSHNAGIHFLQPASAAFSPIAPGNATGNFTKLVQRLPVKIVIDPGQGAARLLKTGMFVTPDVSLHGGTASWRLLEHFHADLP